jgi:excisionase family DNA binding protein
MYLFPNKPVPYIYQDEAMRLLEVGEPVLKQLVATNALRTTAYTFDENESRSYYLILYEDVEQLLKERAKRWSLTQAATYLGIGEDSVEALVETGLLTTAESSLLDGQMVWVFFQENLDEMLQSVLGGLSVQPIVDCEDEDVLCLEQMLRLGSWSGIRLPQLLRDIQRGNLVAFRDQDKLQFATIWCHRSEMLSYITRCRQPDGRIIWSVQQVCDHLRCKPSTLRRLCASKLLVPCQGYGDNEEGRWQYDQADVEAFLDHYINSDGVAEILGVTRITVQQWVRAGRLTAVTGPDIDGSHVYRFEKAAVIAWWQDRLTPGEAMEMLGISKSSLNRWATIGKLQPLDDMGGQHRWFSRADVERLVDEREQVASKKRAKHK